jgi:hypothetical protein
VRRAPRPAESRIRDVEREHAATRSATNYLLDRLRAGAVDLDPDLKRGDVDRASKNLEDVYVVRLFVEFEVLLREFLKANHVRLPPRPSARLLIDRVSTRARVEDSTRANAHRAREFRNSVIHHREGQADVLTIRDMTSFACAFVARLRRYW